MDNEKPPPSGTDDDKAGGKDQSRTAPKMLRVRKIPIHELNTGPIRKSIQGGRDDGKRNR